MNFIEFNKLKENIDKLDINEKENIKKIVKDININDNNFNNWVESIFSNDINKLDMNKLPYVVDELYQTTDKYKFMLCCMLLEATFDKLPFVTKLENYPLFVEKYKILKNTLITVYESCDGGIATCMGLIILKNDPKGKFFDEEERNNFVIALERKLELIYNYIINHVEIDSSVYYDLEVIADLCCYLNNSKISKLIENIDKFMLNDECNIYLLKYKLINNLQVNNKKIEEIINNQLNVETLFRTVEEINKVEVLPLDKITQELIAKSAMIRWLEYPTELGQAPDDISLLGKFSFDGLDCYAYKFKSEKFPVKEYMLGVAGGYEPNKLTSLNSGLIFSKFEKINDDYTKQAYELVKFISDCWKNRNN